MNVAVVTQSLRSQKPSGHPEEDREKLYQKFQTTGQEPVKMATALWGYFELKEIPQKWKQEFETYLKSHVRNAVEALIEENEPEKIQVFEEAGWFGETQLEVFIKIARERQKMQALVYLMKLKNEKYGYKDHDFEL